MEIVKTKRPQLGLTHERRPTGTLTLSRFFSDQATDIRGIKPFGVLFPVEHTDLPRFRPNSSSENAYPQKRNLTKRTQFPFSEQSRRY
jgi:hypothetical protein